MAKIPSLEECKPGIRPTGFNVLVAVEPVEEVTKGGIILTATKLEKDELVQVRGRIVAVSPAAFDFAEWPENVRPAVGDAIQFAKLAGLITTGADGKKYRILLDKDVAAIIDEAAFEGVPA